jgi:hypothetical protein
VFDWSQDLRVGLGLRLRLGLRLELGLGRPSPPAGVKDLKYKKAPAQGALCRPAFALAHITAGQAERKLALAV